MYGHFNSTTSSAKSTNTFTKSSDAKFSSNNSSPSQSSPPPVLNNNKIFIFKATVLTSNLDDENIDLDPSKDIHAVLGNKHVPLSIELYGHVNLLIDIIQ